MKKLVSWIVLHPVLAVFILAASISLLSIKITSIEIDPSAEGLMVEGDPEREYYEQIKETFGDDTLTVVVIKAKDGDVFTEETLTMISELTDEIENIDGVTDVKSLTTVSKIQGEGDFLNTDKLIDEIPSDPEELKRIKRDALRNYINIGNIVSKDGKVAGINIYTEKRLQDKTFNKRVSEEIDRLIEKYRGDHEVYQIGGPLTKITFSSYIESDQKTLIPWCVGAILIILLISFRTPVAVFLPILTGGLSIFATLGFMTLMGYPINVITVIVPSLLIVIGCTEDVHMISVYAKELREGKSKREAIMYMATHSALPITLTSLTTFLGFATLSVNKITILKQFGIVSSFGLFANFVITILVIPSALQFFKAPRKFLAKEEEKTKKTRRMDAVLDGLVNINKNHGFGISVITVVLIGLAILGIFRLRVNTDYISYFKEDSFIRQRAASIHRDLSGAQSFNIIVEAEEEDKIKEPKVLKQIAGLQEFMLDAGIDKSVSIADFIKIVNREMNGGREEMLKIPDEKNLVSQYLLLLGDLDLERYIDDDRSMANIPVRHNISSSWELSHLLNRIREYVRENFSKELTVRFTGEGILVNNASDAMVIGQIESLGLALLAIFIIMTLLFMSLKAGIIAIISNIIPIVLNFGVMGWLGIPLNTGTCMVAAIALGIAVDDTIHFMVRYQRELRATNDQTLAISNTIHGEGEPILFTSLALAIGFGILVMSNFNPTINFGLLAALVMIYALLADLFVNPVILLTVQLITLWDFVALKLKADVTRKSPIFRDLSHSQAKKVILLGSLKEVKAGEYIVRQGERGDEMYMIVSGSAKVEVEREGKRKEVGTLKEGDLFGEMALLGEGIRTAHVIALEDTELLRIDDKALERVRRRNPRIAAKLFLNMSRIISERLKEQYVRG
jgi:hypothetical protein